MLTCEKVNLRKAKSAIDDAEGKVCLAERLTGRKSDVKRFFAPINCSQKSARERARMNEILLTSSSRKYLPLSPHSALYPRRSTREQF